MGFFDGAGDEPPDPDRGAAPDPSREPAPSDLERLAAGGIPFESEQRLAAFSGPGSLFTSTLSANEFALLEELQTVPVAQLLGASVHQVGWQYLPSSARLTYRTVSWELSTVSQAWDQARRRAFDRLAEEARLVGADAVVGVRLRRGEHDWARNSVDFVVTGTGIRIPGAGGARPVLSDLSGQEYWKLAGIGWAPAGLVAATCVFFVAQSSAARFRRRVRFAQNQELEEFSRGFHEARKTVVRYLRNQADAVGATGIVGVELKHTLKKESFKVMSRTVVGGPQGAFGAQFGGGIQQSGADERRGMAITVHAVGTAIRRTAAPPVSAPMTTIRLSSQGAV